jgi:hypothetical protein
MFFPMLNIFGEYYDQLKTNKQLQTVKRARHIKN